MSLAAFAEAIRNPDNPQDPINCPPSGGADLCSKETSCNDRIRINYGQTEKGHYIWYLNDYDPTTFRRESLSLPTPLGRAKRAALDRTYICLDPERSRLGENSTRSRNRV
ncbi:hypothetical protein BD626DRAFT_538400 [Schizophyllum amplum]|uniref:Uncharacterized protein n=1 Tax=Schizophyllum amplum TaxID=97359 RepID=A0A550C8M7_9AGAR|nr:hypothetical protein BD626DRAFT_538400 [Auriculariopsis ampla]